MPDLTARGILLWLFPHCGEVEKRTPKAPATKELTTYATAAATTTNVYNLGH